MDDFLQNFPMLGRLLDPIEVSMNNLVDLFIFLYEN